LNYLTIDMGCWRRTGMIIWKWDRYRKGMMTMTMTTWHCLKGKVNVDFVYNNLLNSSFTQAVCYNIYMWLSVVSLNRLKLIELWLHKDIDMVAKGGWIKISLNQIFGI